MEKVVLLEDNEKHERRRLEIMVGWKTRM